MKHVYVMQNRANGAVKVGVSGDTEQRKRHVAFQANGVTSGVQVKFKTELRADAFSVESIAHRLLRLSHIEGEWFSVEPEEAVQAVNAAIEVIEGKKYIELTPFEVVVLKFGNINRLGEAIGVRSHTSLLRWKDRGLIPAHFQKPVLEAAEALGIDLNAAEVVMGWPSPQVVKELGLDLPNFR